MDEPQTKFRAEAACAAPAREVWKLLYDPVRFSRWWPVGCQKFACPVSCSDDERQP